MKTFWTAAFVTVAMATAGHANHNGFGNQQVVQIARILAQQANFAVQQAHRLMAGGWGSSWQDQRALRDLGLFAQQAHQLAQVAASCGNGGGWPGNGNGNGGWNRGWGNGNGHNGPGHGNGGWNGGQNNAQLSQQFWATWQQANEVERSLARAPRLQTINGFWNAQVSGTLRQLRAAIGGGWGNGGGYPRDGRRESLFDRLFN